MKLFSVTYQHRIYERRSTCGGMDSESTGRSHLETVTQYVVAEDIEHAAIAYPWERVHGNKPEIKEEHPVHYVVTVSSRLQ